LPKSLLTRCTGCSALLLLPRPCPHQHWNAGLFLALCHAPSQAGQLRPPRGSLPPHTLWDHDTPHDPESCSDRKLRLTCLGAGINQVITRCMIRTVLQQPIVCLKLLNWLTVPQPGPPASIISLQSVRPVPHPHTGCDQVHRAGAQRRWWRPGERLHLQPQVRMLAPSPLCLQGLFLSVVPLDGRSLDGPLWVTGCCWRSGMGTLGSPP